MRYAVLAVGLAALFLGLFLVVEALGVPLLVDPSPWLARPGVPAAATGVGLLVADVLLPVPSSLVMIAHGALFGVWVGTLLSLAGGLGAAMFGFALGRRAQGPARRITDGGSRARAEALLARYGLVAIVLTRPVPILAETTAILAGANPRLSAARVALAAAAGTLPVALVYAVAGALAASFAEGAVVFALVLLVAGLFALLTLRGDPAAEPAPDPDPSALQMNH